MQLDIYATESHYIQHAVPILLRTPAEYRGVVVVPTELSTVAEGFPSRTYVTQHEAGEILRNRIGPLLVASYGDLVRVRHLLRGAVHRRPIVYMEHGIGQTYKGKPRGTLVDEAYAGGERQNVDLILVPGRHAALAYDRGNVVQIGSPFVDWMKQQVAPKTKKSGVPIVSFGWHWNDIARPETTETWAFWMPAIAKLHEGNRYRLLGHGHPRSNPSLWEAYKKHEIPMTHSFLEVCSRADVFCFDNTSAGYEFAAITGRPVVVLNHPFYRRGTEHGLRFWSMAGIGPQVDTADNLLAGVIAAMTDASWDRARADILGQIFYRLGDGMAAQRAVEAILGLTY